MSIKIAGYYQITILRANGKIEIMTPFFDNLITNQGLDLMGTGFSAIMWAATGNTPPAVTDTGLSGSIVGASSSWAETAKTSQLTTPPWYHETTYANTFAVGAVVGAVSEVGIGSGNATTVTSIFSRSLIKDAYGNPITITLTSADQLQVIYKLRHYLQYWASAADDIVTEVYINGLLRTCKRRPMSTTDADWWSPRLGGAVIVHSTSHCGVFSGALVTPTGSPSGVVGSSNTSNDAYVPGSYTRGFSFYIPPQSGNITVAGMHCGPNRYWGRFGGRWQISIEPSFTKSNLQALNMSGYFSWDRYSA